MKTYTRRKPVHKLIENVHDLCRLCLQNTRDTETVVLFTSEHENMCPSLITKIMICLGIELENEESLPNKICTDCYDKINNYYTFKKKCGVAYQTFKSHFLATLDTNSKCISPTEEQNVNKQPDLQSFSIVNCKEEKIILTFEENKQLNVKTSEIIPISNEGLVNGIQHEGPLPEISKFLNIILLELGIVRKKDDNFIQCDFLGSTIELETGDGCQMTLQLSEIVDEKSNIGSDQQPCESTQTSVIRVEDKPEIKNGRAVCRVCGKGFVSRGVLRRHARTHSGERPYACRSCPRRFTQREVLTRHELVHLEHRPFACDLCPKSFTQRSALTTHRRSHVPPAARPFALHRCLICPKFFLHASGLSRHLRTHSGQPQVSCGTCGRSFRDRDALQRHVRRTHARSSDAAQNPPQT